MDRGRPMRAVERDKQRGGAMSGEYVALYDYLERRYAGTVVLTVTEIEDILGFALPDAARLDQRWWADPGQGTALAGCQDAWRLAGRMATPNLAAQTIVFERSE
ncbi:MAG: hypothetical protein AB7F99_13020 [Vicinamibacterales bacterium]